MGGSRRRTNLALGVERLVDAAERPRPRLSSAIPPQADQVHAARPALKTIAAILRSGDPVGDEGLALVAGLLSDGAGPAFAPAPPGALAADAERALYALLALTTETTSSGSSIPRTRRLRRSPRMASGRPAAAGEVASTIPGAAALVSSWARLTGRPK
jgi:hypothetical protein